MLTQILIYSRLMLICRNYVGVEYACKYSCEQSMIHLRFDKVELIYF